MKLRKDDNVVVIAGRDKGKTGKILSVVPALGKVVVEGINISKRHTKPSQTNPRGGILDLIKPIDASKVMALDPATGKQSRIGYEILADGTKQRVFKVSSNLADKKTAKAPKAAATKIKTAESSKDIKADKK